MQFNTHTFKVYTVQTLIPSRNPGYIKFNTHTFKTPQVYAVQYSYIQDTSGICNSTPILSRHPRYMQHHTFKTLQIYSSTPKFQNCTFLFFLRKIGSMMYLSITLIKLIYQTYSLQTFKLFLSIESLFY